MSKLKENILFFVIFFTIYTALMIIVEYWRYDEIDFVKNVIGGVIVTTLLLLDKIYKFSDKIKKKLTFIK